MTDKEDVPFRGAVFGMTSHGVVVCVKQPTKVEDCGLYIHVDDFEKYQEWQKQFEDPEEKHERRSN